MTPTELAPRFFIAVAVILLFCKLVAWLLGKVGQPAGGQRDAGRRAARPVAARPAAARASQDALFPAALLPVLYVVGQVGLVLFMFQAGYALRRATGCTGLAGTAGAVSLAGVTVPLVLGVLLVLVTAGHGADPGRTASSLGVSAAFVGVALAITAFPMLARIITERGQAGTRHGSLALASGAIDDAGRLDPAGRGARRSPRARPARPLVTVGGAVLFGAALLARRPAGHRPR